MKNKAGGLSLKTFLSGLPMILTLTKNMIVFLPLWLGWGDAWMLGSMRCQFLAWPHPSHSHCHSAPQAWIGFLRQRRDTAIANLRIAMKDLYLFYPFYFIVLCRTLIHPHILSAVFVTVLEGNFSRVRFYAINIYRQLNPGKYYKLQIIIEFG